MCNSHYAPWYSATLVHLQQPAELTRGWLSCQPYRTSAQMEVGQNANKSEQGKALLAYMDGFLGDSLEMIHLKKEHQS